MDTRAVSSFARVTKLVAYACVYQSRWRVRACLRACSHMQHHVDDTERGEREAYGGERKAHGGERERDREGAANATLGRASAKFAPPHTNSLRATRLTCAVESDGAQNAFCHRCARGAKAPRSSFTRRPEGRHTRRPEALSMRATLVSRSYSQLARSHMRAHRCTGTRTAPKVGRYCYWCDARCCDVTIARR